MFTDAKAPALQESTPRLPIRLWPAVALVGLYWLARTVVFHTDTLYFYRFLFTMLSAAMLTLALLVWWLSRRRARFVDRAYHCGLIALGCVAAGLVCDPSIGWFGLLTGGLPVVLTAWTAWLIIAQCSGFAWHRLGAFVVVMLMWSYFTILRNDGVDTNLQADIRWRWNPNAEQLFLAERAPADESQPTAPTGWNPVLTAEDWPEFRGPERDGVIRGIKLATDWSGNPPRRLWQRRVGPAWSSVIVVGDRLFTQEQHGELEAVVCYDALTGQQLWSHEDRARFWETVSGAGPRATPTYASGRIFAMGGTGLLTCLDAATGQRHWSRDVAVEAAAKPPMWGVSSSPLVVDGLVIVFAGTNGDKSLVAYRADTGEPAWTALAGSDSYSSPQLLPLAGRRQVLFLSDDGLAAVDPANGAVLWTHGQAAKGAPHTIQAHVIGDNQFIYGSIENARPRVYRIEVKRDNDSWNVSQLWATSDLKPEYNDLVVHQGYGYGYDTTRLCCIDLATGKLCWKGPRLGRGQIMVLPEQSLLLVLCETGEAVLLAANPQEPEELGRFQALGGKTWNHPVVAHGRLYVRNAEEMACYELNRP